MLTERDKWILRLLARQHPVVPAAGAPRSGPGASCPPFTDLIELATGKAPAEAAAELQHHLQQCAPCRSSFESLQRFVTGEEDVEDPVVAGSRLEQVSKDLLAAHRSKASEPSSSDQLTEVSLAAREAETVLDRTGRSRLPAQEKQQLQQLVSDLLQEVGQPASRVEECLAFVGKRLTELPTEQRSLEALPRLVEEFSRR